MAGSRTNPRNGLLVLDRNFTVPSKLVEIGVGGILSDYTQAGSLPGSLLETTLGVVPAISNGQGENTIQLKVKNPGFPGRAKYSYTLTSGGVDVSEQRGWSPPYSVKGWEPMVWTTTANYGVHSTVVIPRTQNIVTVYCDAVGGTGTGSLFVIRRDATDWGSPITVDTSPVSCCGIVHIPGTSSKPRGRLVIIALDNDDKFLSYVSEDDGATWSVLAGINEINQTVVEPCQRMTVTMIKNDIAIVVKSATGTEIYQYASQDGGCTIDLVSDRPSNQFPRFVGFGTETLLATTTAADDQIGYRLMTSAYQRIEDAPFTILAAGLTAAAGCAGCKGPDGTYYVATTLEVASSFRAVNLFYTDDLNKTWQSAVFYRSRDVATQPGDSIELVISSERLFMVGIHEATPGNEDGSLSAFKLSQWSNLEIHAEPEMTLVPFDLPADVGNGWAHTGAANPTIDSSGNFSYITAANANNDVYTAVGTGLSSGVQFQMAVVSGGGAGVDDIMVRLTSCDGSDTYNCRIRFSTTNFRVVDTPGGVNLATVTHDTTELTDYLMFYNGAGGLSVYYKSPDEVDWTEVLDETAVTSTGAGTAAWVFVQGHVTASATASSIWRYTTLYDDIGTVRSGANLRGKVITTFPVPIAGNLDDDNNTNFVSILGGFADPSDEYNMVPNYRYSVNNMFPEISASPYKDEWRSTDTTAHLFSFDIGDRSFLGGAMGVFFGNINFNGATLEYFNATSGSWVVVGTLDASAGMSSGAYDLSGTLLEPASGTASSQRYIQPGELKDGYVKLVNGGNPLDIVYRRIVDNTGGYWDDVSSVRATITIEITGAEASAGTVTPYWPNAVLLEYLTSNQVREHWGIRIPAQDNADGYFRIGTLGIGRLVPFGKPWGWNREENVTPLFEPFIDRAGVESRIRLGRDQRTWTFDFSDGVNNLNWRQGTSSEVNWVGTSAGTRLVGKDTTWIQLRDIMERTNGYSVPVVALDTMQASATITDTTLYNYGYLDGSQSYSVISGTEGTDEVIRIDSVTVKGIR